MAFSPLSASVHLLNASARTLLESIAAAPLTADEMLSALARAIDRPIDDELATAVRDTVHGLDRAGLIEPA